MILFTYLHLAPIKSSAKQLLKHKVGGIAYDDYNQREWLAIADANVEVARRIAIQFELVPRKNGRRTGHPVAVFPVFPAARVVIIGGGVVRADAAEIAVGIGAHVTMMDDDLERSS